MTSCFQHGLSRELIDLANFRLKWFYRSNHVENRSLDTCL